MSTELNRPDLEREKLRQEELKNNPAGNLRDAFNHSNQTDFTQLTGGMNTKTTGIILMIIIISIAVGWMIFGH